MTYTINIYTNTNIARAQSNDKPATSKTLQKLIYLGIASVHVPSRDNNIDM